jgi:hypothetical protein
MHLKVVIDIKLGGEKKGEVSLQEGYGKHLASPTHPQEQEGREYCLGMAV